MLWIVVGAATIAAVFAMPSPGGPPLAQQVKSLIAREKKLEKLVNALARRPRSSPNAGAGAAIVT